jgi:predicted metal-dependent phosphoesterase TrpH
MFIDLHVHENLYSPCSRMSLETAVRAARAAGLDGLCVTDHDSMDIRKSAADFIRRSDFPIFVGAEISTRDGHIVVLGIDETPPACTRAEEVVAFTLARGGFCFAAHPFRYDGSGPGRTLPYLDDLPGIEVCNGGNSEEENAHAVSLCRKTGLIPVAGSDAHRPENVGRFATWFPETVRSVAELAAALNAGRCSPARKRGRDAYDIVDIWEGMR